MHLIFGNCYVSQSRKQSAASHFLLSDTSTNQHADFRSDLVLWSPRSNVLIVTALHNPTPLPHVFFFFARIFETESHWLACKLLCSPSWPQTHIDLPCLYLPSAAIKACTIMLGPLPTFDTTLRTMPTSSARFKA